MYPVIVQICMHVIDWSDISLVSVHQTNSRRQAQKSDIVDDSVSSSSTSQSISSSSTAAGSAANSQEGTVWDYPWRVNFSLSLI